MTTHGKPTVSDNQMLADMNDRKDHKIQHFFDQKENFTNHINAMYITKDELSTQIKNLVNEMYRYDITNESIFSATCKLETDINILTQQYDAMQKNIKFDEMNKQSQCILEKMDYARNKLAILKNQIITNQMLKQKQNTVKQLESEYKNIDNQIIFFEKYHKKILHTIEHRIFSDIPKLINECLIEYNKFQKNNNLINGYHTPYGHYCNCDERVYNYEFHVWESSCKYSGASTI